MKIVVVGTRGFPGVQGGVETHCRQLYPSLADRGCNITAFARTPYVDSKPYTYQGVSVIPLSCPGNKFLEAFVHTFKGVVKAHKLRPDILHIHAVGPSLFVPLARLLGMKVVITNHGPDYNRMKWPPAARMFLRFCERIGIVFANEVITVSGSIADDIKKKYGRESVVIPNGVDLPSPLDTENALRKYGLRKGGYILAVGRFVPEKGFDDLIDAFNRLRLKDRKLVIAGDADHEDKYSQALKAKAGSNDNIILTGFITGEPLHELYSHAGLFVLPSYHEGLPIVLLEAMSYGLSCIASDIPANRNVELDGERFFEAGNVSLLADRIAEFINRPWDAEERKKQIGLIAEKYNWGKIADMTLEVYRKVAP